MWSLRISFFGHDRVAFLIHDIPSHQQADTNGVGDRFQRTEWEFPQISQDQFAAKTLLVVQDSFLLRTFLRPNSHALKIEPLDTKRSERAHGLPMQEMHRSQRRLESRTSIAVISRVIAKRGDHASLNYTLTLGNKYLHVLAKRQNPVLEFAVFPEFHFRSF